MPSAGIDLGTTFVKDHTGHVFPAGISGETYNSARNIMKLNGKQYAMGQFNERACYDVNVNKGLNRNARLNFLYALRRLASYYPDDPCVFDVALVGLPGLQWKNEENVQKYKELLDVTVPVDVEIDGISKEIQVLNVEVVPEGSTAYYVIPNYEEKYRGQKVLLLDWGGLTLNQNMFHHDEIIDVHTDEDGALKVYRVMAGQINSRLGTNVKAEEMHDVLTKGLTIKGKPYPVDDIIRDTALSYCEIVYRNLKLRWSIDTIPYVPMVGAASITMEKYIKVFIPHAELQEDAQILAAIGMGEAVGACTL